MVFIPHLIISRKSLKKLLYTIDDNTEFVIDADASQHSLSALNYNMQLLRKQHMLLLKPLGNGITFFIIVNLNH